jgi:ABC-type sugar transport system ATPase subunit
VAKVEFVDVVKRYDDVQVVHGISFTVESGEFLVLVGQSGCGKSTCLRMIAGLEEITEGEIRIDGKVVNDVAPKDRDIGMVFQSYALYPHMTVRENMGFGLKIRKMDKATIDKRVQEAAKMLDLEPLLDRKPKALSGGQRQRVAIGRAIVREPRIFLFDEPLSNLDAALRGQMRAEIAKLHSAVDTTMVYVTHDQVEAMTLADRIAVFNVGYLEQIGSPMELYSRPATKFVGGFIGSPPMNFIEGKLADGKFTAEGVEVAFSDVDHSGDVTLGIRPQDVGLDGDIETTVDLVELLGWEAILHVTTNVGGYPMRVRMDGTRAAGVSRGDALSISISAEGSHLFDADEKSIWAAPGAEQLDES